MPELNLSGLEVNFYPNGYALAEGNMTEIKTTCEKISQMTLPNRRGMPRKVTVYNVENPEKRFYEIKFVEPDERGRVVESVGLGEQQMRNINGDEWYPRYLKMIKGKE